MTGIYDRSMATALRLITKYGQSCFWTKQAPPANGADPWRDERAGDPTVYPVSIAWFPTGRRNLPMIALIPQTEVPEATEVGIMGHYGFDPKLVDTIDRNGIIASVLHIDTLQPNGSPVFYVIYVKDAGPGNNF